MSELRPDVPPHLFADTIRFGYDEAVRMHALAPGPPLLEPDSETFWLARIAMQAALALPFMPDVPHTRLLREALREFARSEVPSRALEEQLKEVLW